jgi:CRISPR-associated protein Cas5t
MNRSAETQAALRIVVEGPITSFRYPHFMQGTQPTYEMPPPATLYGHVCSALGESIDPAAFRVAVRFTFRHKFLDYEHTHMVGGKESGVKLSPTRRELLFEPRLTLYIDRPEWRPQFRQPRYVVTLGRSQDLMRYTSVAVVTLHRAERAYLEHTALPLRSTDALEGYIARALPRWITPDRAPQWGQYAIVGARQAVTMPDMWVDPDSERWRGLQRGVVWLGFV